MLNIPHFLSLLPEPYLGKGGVAGHIHVARLGFLTKCLYGAYRAEEEGKQKTEGGGQELGGGQLVKLLGAGCAEQRQRQNGMESVWRAPKGTVKWAGQVCITGNRCRRP